MSVAPSKSGPPEPFAALDPGSRVEVEVGGRVWLLDRAADMEALWDAMDEGDLDEDERLPYWAEVWPASVLLGRHILRNADRLKGRTCLDVGCGLGLTGMIAASVGANVAAFDYEWPAVRFARHNAAQNDVPQPLWLLMDWRKPALKPGGFEFIWGGDVLYEKRFFDPLIRLFRHALAPSGRIWIGEPVRTVSRPVWERLADEGFATRKLTVEKVALCGQDATVNLWEITIPPIVEDTMGKTIRFGVSLDSDLLEKFDQHCEERSYQTRSEAIRDLIRNTLVQREWEQAEGDLAGTLTLVYDHHKSGLSQKLTEIQHDSHEVIQSSLHVHLDHFNCLEVIILKGDAEVIKELGQKLISTKGVKHGNLALTTTGKDLI